MSFPTRKCLTWERQRDRIELSDMQRALAAREGSSMSGMSEKIARRSRMLALIAGPSRSGVLMCNKDWSE